MLNKLKNKFIILIPSFNCKGLIQECLESVLNQEFEDLGIIIRDDLSTDGTRELIDEILQTEKKDQVSKVRIKNKDVIFEKNAIKMFPVGNTYDSVMKYVEDPESIIGVVDGDDKLIDKTATSKILNVYNEQHKWLVWSQHVKSDGSKGECKPLPSDNFIYSSRNYWSASHFRTSKAFLFHALNKNDLKDPFVPNSYYTFSGDAAFLFPFCEMCGNDKSFFLNEVLYYYNCQLPSNEHNKSLSSAIKYGSFIRTNGNRYKKLSR